MSDGLEIRGATFLADDPGVVRHLWVVRGPEGAVSFVWADWHPNASDETRAVDTDFLIRYGNTLMPMAYDLGYHSFAPMSDWQAQHGPIHDNCDWLDGAICYGDGSTARAFELFDGWLIQDMDEQWLFGQLEAYYNAVFRSDGNGPLELGEMLHVLLGLGADE